MYTRCTCRHVGYAGNLSQMVCGYYICKMHDCYCMLFDTSRTGVTPFTVVTNCEIMVVR